MGILSTHSRLPVSAPVGGTQPECGEPPWGIGTKDRTFGGGGPRHTLTLEGKKEPGAHSPRVRSPDEVLGTGEAEVSRGQSSYPYRGFRLICSRPLKFLFAFSSFFLDLVHFFAVLRANKHHSREAHET